MVDERGRAATAAGKPFAALQQKVADRTAFVGVIGLGYVGLPLALSVCEAGYRTTGFDLNADRVASINRGERVISYLEPERVRRAVGAGELLATASFERLSEMDAIAICVPTPLDAAREPNLSFVRAATETVAGALRPGQLVVLESTMPPGTTRDVVAPMLDGSGLARGADYFLAFSPEREDPGNPVYETKTIPKIVSADDPSSLALARSLYERIVTEVTEASSTAAAEAAKLLENTFRAVNIALVNELKVALAAMDIDIWEVIEAASTKPFGFMPFYPGPGVGGHCTPVSPVLLSSKARASGAPTPLVDLAGQVNDAMPRAVVDVVGREVEHRLGKPLADASVLLVGICYKKNVEDTRVSPAMTIFDLLLKAAARCEFHDPYFPVFPMTRDHPHHAGRKSAGLSEAELAAYDAVLICTDHDDVDYGLIARAAPLVVDTRNVMARLGLGGDRVVKA